MMGFLEDINLSVFAGLLCKNVQNFPENGGGMVLGAEVTAILLFLLTHLCGVFLQVFSLLGLR